MELITNYKNNDRLRQSFNQLSKKTFGIDFENWYQQGLWQDNYICYSFRDGDNIIANVSVTKMRLQIVGKEKKLIQIGTVMTDINYREKGLARKLMKHVLKKYQAEYEGFYLFANENVLNFYPKFGFKKVKRLELFSSEQIVREPIYRFRKLDMNNSGDLKILTSVSERRTPTSRKFFFKNNQEILHWYCLGLFKDIIYYNEDEEVIIIYANVGNRLNIYDVISTKEVSYRNILKSIHVEGVNEIVFQFNLEAEDLKIESRLFDDVEEDDPMFVRGNLNMSGLTYPVTSHT